MIPGKAALLQHQNVLPHNTLHRMVRGILASFHWPEFYVKTFGETDTHP